MPGANGGVYGGAGYEFVGQKAVVSVTSSNSGIAASANGADAAPAALLRGVAKRFGATEALRGFDLEVRAGELVALLGPNGAGKTTAIGLLLGLRLPDAGQVRLLGGDPRSPAVRRGVGVTPQETGFPPNLRVHEVINLVRAHYDAPAETADLLKQFGLADLATRQTGGLSGGEKRRLAVALAFAGAPKIVFLDEPTTGLDVASRRALWDAIKDFVGGGGTVLLTTHYIEEADVLADRIVVIDQGKSIAAGTPAEIKSRIQLQRVSFAAEELPDLPGIVRHERDGARHVILTDDADALVRALVGSGAAFSGLEISLADLEEAFVALMEEGA